jgi:ABC-type dipeptide/oligopeptide/nickel transport system ATPase component
MLLTVGLALGGLTVAAAVVAADPLQLAQSASGNTALSVAEIRECLCLDQQMTFYHQDLDLKQDLLNERQQELANIDQQVQEQRAALDPTDRVGQQVLKDLMAQQQGLRDQLQHDLRPAYNTEVNQLNAMVSKYNGHCVNRQRYTVDVKAAQEDLQCPKP